MRESLIQPQARKKDYPKRIVKNSNELGPNYMSKNLRSWKLLLLVILSLIYWLRQQKLTLKTKPMLSLKATLRKWQKWRQQQRWKQLWKQWLQNDNINGNDDDNKNIDNKNEDSKNNNNDSDNNNENNNNYNSMSDSDINSDDKDEDVKITVRVSEASMTTTRTKMMNVITKIKVCVIKGFYLIFIFWVDYNTVLFLSIRRLTSVPVFKDCYISIDVFIPIAPSG